MNLLLYTWKSLTLLVTWDVPLRREQGKHCLCVYTFKIENHLFLELQLRIKSPLYVDIKKHRFLFFILFCFSEWNMVIDAIFVLFICVGFF